MKVVVTGSCGHLGEALVRTLRDANHEVVGLDVKPSPFTTTVGSINDRDCVKNCMRGAEVVYHTAALHKPHVVTHAMRDFVATNVLGTLTLLEEAVASRVGAFVFTSTTSVFGDAFKPAPGVPAVWVTEAVAPIPKNVYGVTKTAAEDFCRLVHRKHGLPCVVLRTSRFFPEEDDDKATRLAYDDDNAKVNELPFRRVDLEDVVSAHLLAAESASSIGFGKYVISATTPFLPEDLADLRTSAPRVLRKRAPEYEEIYRRLEWRMFDGIDRVYVNDAARRDLNWRPKHNFSDVLSRLRQGAEPHSPITAAVGKKGYHEETFDEGPYPVE